MNLKNASRLVIDDDPDVLTAVRLLLKTEAADVVTEKNPENMRSILSKRTFDLILLDMNFNSSINTGNEGLFWLRKIKEFGSDAAVIMITAYGDIDLAVRSLKEGAADFVVKPWHNERVTYRGDQALVMPGLDDKIRGALFERSHGQVDVPIGGDHDHRRIGPEFADPPEPEQPFIARIDRAVEVHVQEDHVECPFGQERPHIFRVLLGNYFHRFRFQ